VNLDTGTETDLRDNRPPQPRSEGFASASAGESTISWSSYPAFFPQ